MKICELDFYLACLVFNGARASSIFINLLYVDTTDYVWVKSVTDKLLQPDIQWDIDLTLDSTWKNR